MLALILYPILSAERHNYPLWFIAFQTNLAD